MLPRKLLKGLSWNFRDSTRSLYRASRILFGNLRATRTWDPATSCWGFDKWTPAPGGSKGSNKFLAVLFNYLNVPWKFQLDLFSSFQKMLKLEVMFQNIQRSCRIFPFSPESINPSWKFQDMLASILKNKLISFYVQLFLLKNPHKNIFMSKIISKFFLVKNNNNK